MPAKSPVILVQKLQADIAVVILKRPEAANALSKQMAEEISAAFEAIQKDSSIRVVIVAGDGEKVFCAGADLKERKNITEAQWHDQHRALEGALQAILECPLPVIAAVNGAAFGGGLELALACDFIYTVSHARFALTETSLGIMPGLGGMVQLSRAVGARRAKELVYSAAPFSAEEALEWGMVNKVCEGPELFAQTLTIAQQIAANAPLAVRAVKKASRETETLPLEQALATELKHYNRLLGSKDRHEGTNAFNEKRPPVFSGQ